MSVPNISGEYLTIENWHAANQHQHPPNTHEKPPRKTDHNSPNPFSFTNGILLLLQGWLVGWLVD